MAPAVKSPAQPRGCTNLKLRQLARRVARLYDQDQRALGLNGTQYSLLSTVIKLAPVTQAALAAALKLDPSTLTRNLKPLIARGLVRVDPGADARSHRVIASDAGCALREQAQRGWKRSQLGLNARLGPERVVALHALLDECLALLEDRKEGDDE